MKTIGTSSRIGRIRPAFCRLGCADCFVYASCRNAALDIEAGIEREPPPECRTCRHLRDDETVCWGALCAMRNCCQNCGLGYALQCRRHPCRKMYLAGRDP